MTPSGQHLQLFNPKPNVFERTFHPFPRLPLEIRRMIWEHELHHERFIRVRVLPDDVCEQPAASRNYIIAISGPPAISKMFHVNTESRSCASRFYRVQLPCRYEWDGRVEEKGTFYFNPELDTLEVWRPENFVYLAYDIWKHDPRRVGLLRLAVDIWRPRPLFDRLRAYENKTLLREVLARLKHVTFIEKGSVGRMYLHTNDDTRNPEFHRSRPIMAVASSFQRLPDPRPIQTDLRRLHVGLTEPRREIHKWVCLMAWLDVRAEIEYSLMITYGAARPRIWNWDDAVKYVQQEDLEWRGELERRQAISQRPGSLATLREETPEELDQAPQPAIGFWLFPIECLGPLPPVSQDPDFRIERFLAYGWVVSRGRRRRRRFRSNIDVAEYRPELCLFDLA